MRAMGTVVASEPYALMPDALNPTFLAASASFANLQLSIESYIAIGRPAGGCLQEAELSDPLLHTYLQSCSLFDASDLTCDWSIEAAPPKGRYIRPLIDAFKTLAFSASFSLQNEPSRKPDCLYRTFTATRCLRQSVLAVDLAQIPPVNKPSASDPDSRLTRAADCLCSSLWRGLFPAAP